MGNFKISVILFSIFSIIAHGCLSDGVPQTYQSFCAKFNTSEPSCPSNPEQFQNRRKIYEKNLASLHCSETTECNACGRTKFVDLTDEEFQKRLGVKEFPEQFKVKGPQLNLKKSLQAPLYLDWSSRDVVTSIKDQGSCGTCWSFATVAMIESSLIMKDQAGSDIDLSEQFLLDCTPYSTCEGGYLFYATETAIKKGLPHERQLPYQERVTGNKQLCEGGENHAKSSLFFNHYSNLNQQEVKQLLTEGPLSIAVAADTWRYYTGGIHSCGYGEQVNHAVLLVGYDQDSWLIKNQWGEDWGENGYMRIAFGEGNNCGIGTEVIMLFEGYFFGALLMLGLFWLLA